MAARIENNRVLREHMQKFIGADTPGVGTYDPLKETLEDKKKLKVLKRLNMYAGATRSNKGTGVYSATGPGSMQASRAGSAAQQDKLQERAT